MRTIYTVGYSTTTPQELKKLVLDTDSFLVDTRLVPYSKYFPEWRKAELRGLVGKDRYAWLGETLGNLNYKNGGNIQIADLPIGLAHLERALKLKNVILLCGCYDVQKCHRLVIANGAHAKLKTVLENECLVGLDLIHWEGNRRKVK
jgi:uncharacterized protein (DUF488 family)